MSKRNIVLLMPHLFSFSKVIFCLMVALQPHQLFAFQRPPAQLSQAGGGETTEKSERPPSAIHDVANFFSAGAGAQIVASSASGHPDYKVAQVIDPQLGSQGKWRVKNRDNGRDELFPHWYVIELPQLTSITTLAFNTHTVDEQAFKGVTAKRLEIEFSKTGPNKDFAPVSTEFLKKGREFQVFSIATDSVRWVRISIVNNWGNEEITEIGRVYGYNDLAYNQYESTLLVDGVLELRDIQFDHNSTSIAMISYPLVDILAQVFKSHSDWKVLIEGHTDDVGDASYNMDLSERRAKAVQDYLLQAGVLPDRLEHKGFGDKQPVVENDSEEGRALNRRVTFKLIR